ncbi:MAG: hypothetical protein WAM70_14475 [Pyrinomonadaceae bacterium]
MLALMCGLNGRIKANAVAMPTAPADKPQYETRVYTRRQCLISEANVLPTPTPTPQGGPEFLGAVLAIFVPLLIEKALGGVGSAMKKAGAVKTEKDAGRLPTYLYQITDKNGSRAISMNPNLGCVLVVRGTFSAADPADQSKIDFSPSGVLTGDNQEAQRITRLQKSNIPIKEIASLYEAEITTSNEQTALYYQSKFFEVNSFQGSSSSDTRGMVVSLAINGPGPKEGEPTLSLALVNFGDIKRGSILDAKQLNGRRSGWLGGVGMTEDALKAVEKVKLEKNTSKGVMPITLEATVTETEDGNKALQFIGEVLDATKGEVSKTVSSEILDKEKRATAAADALEKLRQDEETAYAAFLSAKVDKAKLSNPPPEERAAAEHKVTVTKRAWCLKFNALKNMGVTVSRADTCQ